MVYLTLHPEAPTITSTLRSHAHPSTTVATSYCCDNGRTEGHSRATKRRELLIHNLA